MLRNSSRRDAHTNDRTDSIANENVTFTIEKMFKKRKMWRERKRKIAARVFYSCTSSRPPRYLEVSQVDLNVSRDFASDFNYPSPKCHPSHRSSAIRPGRRAVFPLLTGKNAMNALVDNEISRQFHRRRRGVLTELILVDNKIASA